MTDEYHEYIFQSTTMPTTFALQGSPLFPWHFLGVKIARELLGQLSIIVQEAVPGELKIDGIFLEQ